MPRESFHMQLLDHGLDQGPPERSIALPVVLSRVGNDAFHRRGGVVARPSGGAAIVCLRDGYGEAIGIEQHLLAVEANPLIRSRAPCAR